MSDRVRQAIEQSRPEDRAPQSLRRRRDVPAIVDLATETRVWLRLEPLAVYWDVTMQGIRKWIRQGALPASRFGRSWRVKTTAAREFESRNPVNG